uniref:TNFR-Cys domain-containing protein n=1 Tax=Scleropages formosus TaxID=113540 RepID=A0A8C9VY46_SCLFO
FFPSPQICAVFLLLLKSDLCPPCDRAEYEKNGECCPMCPPGTRVHRHCTAYTSTTCVPCIGDTFTDKPNGLISCFPCTVCQKGLGVKTVKECTASSDTVCGVLEGNYSAQKHTTCKPGHFIKHPGTHSNDTVCENCPENSFSDGSSTFCTPHTNCKANRLPTVKAGDSVSDAECGERSQIPVIVAIIALVCYLVVIIREIYKCKYQKTASPPNGDAPKQERHHKFTALSWFCVCRDFSICYVLWIH